MKRPLLLMLAALGVLTAGAQATYKNPVYNGDFPDPSVERALDGYFYTYGTGCKARKSKDLVNWTSISNVIGRPMWNDSTYVDANGNKKTDYYSFWACDVSRTDDNNYLMYYACALWGNGTRTGIGVATATGPDKFTDAGRLFRSTEIGVHNSIDPVYVEEFDKKYLAWGSFHDIYIAELTDDGLAIKDFKKKTKLAGGAFEGAMIYKRGNYYYLFCSVGSCCEGANSTYRTVVGRSTNLMGPYTNKQGGSMINNNYTTIISGDDRWKGPGHNSEIITDDNGDDWLLYHSYDTNNNCNGRLLLLDKITWGSDGWPTINNGHPSRDAMPAPVFRTGNGANITYKLRNMDLMKSGWKCWDVKASDDCQWASGRGTAFMPLGYAKGGGTFDASQTITGVSQGIYEMQLENFATEGSVDLYVGKVATPAFHPAKAGVTAPSSESVISNNFLRANNKYKQSALGLVIDGKLTIGMRTRDSLQPGERYYAGAVKVIYREKDPEAIRSVLNSYYDMMDERLAQTGYYNAYKPRLQAYREAAEASEEATVQYNQLVKIHRTLDSIQSSVEAYEKLRLACDKADEALKVAIEGGFFSEAAEAVVQEGRDTWSSGNCKDKDVAALVTRIEKAIHDMNYAYQRGDGTKENPYIISRPDQLDHMHDVLIKEQMVYFEMEADVDMAGYAWKQLNSSESNYRYWINLDGKGHIIYNLTPEGSKNYPSFFGTMCGEIRNVGFVDAKVEATASGAAVIGGYMGHSTFKDAEGVMLPVVVENCYVTGEIVSKGYVGAIGGTLNSSPIIIRNCYSAVDITGNGGSANYSGGLVGRVRSGLTIDRCYAAGKVSSPVAGGVVAGGQSKDTPASVYTNVIAWNPTVSGSTAEPFGTLQAADALTDVYLFADMTVNDTPVEGGKTHSELQQIVASWGAPWHSDPTAGNGYPILQWQYTRDDYWEKCGFPFTGDPTHIAQPAAARATDGAVYDLSGRRVEHPGKGLYIVNGRKVVR